MKKPKVHILVILTLVFAAFTFGLYLGRNQNAASITVSIPPAMQTLPPETTEAAEVPTEETQGISFPISINSACKEELMALPEGSCAFGAAVLKVGFADGTVWEAESDLSWHVL